MKAQRHALILTLIREYPVGTQEELGELLRAEGVEVTQATLSRDIKELGLAKKVMPDGSYRYALPGEKAVADVLRRAERVFQDAVVNIDHTENLIVIKTLNGTAQGVAAALDDLEWSEIMGTIAGDDTILVIVRKRDQVAAVLEQLHKLRR
ncbi:MAG TPA: arginine repressor [Firmicutes bacterium]|jgi:transcriptional regulator of arginine metabolism|nr:arginine repressor [Bacillota bacterium]HOQ24176.1 arginine repressor [Bacillota bacterium]HPT67587.1 arginine repressor [Bacillota bacterium]